MIDRMNVAQLAALIHATSTRMELLVAQIASSAVEEYGRLGK